jgi:hypothetical protein
MPVEKMYSDPMLDTFRNMMKEVNDKGYKGESVDNMRSTLDQMEKYAQEMSDFMEFSAKLTTENLFGKFSDYYSRTLASNASTGGYDPNGPYDEKNDQALLKLMIDALKNSIKSIRDSKAETKKLMGDRADDLDVLFKEKALIDGIQKLIDLGESGISAPEYLRIQTEKNLDKAMQGNAVMRDGLVYALSYAEALASSPYYIQKCKKHLQIFDEMSKASPIGSPDVTKYHFACEKFDASIITEDIKWERIKDAIEQIVGDLYTWATVHLSYAHTLEPWSMAKNPKQSVERDRDCYPGIIVIREEIMNRNFGLTVNTMVKHDVMKWLVQYNWFWYSQEMTEFLIKEVYPHCKPNQYLPKELIDKMDAMYKGDHSRNPELHKIGERCAVNFDSYFGVGEYNKRYPSTPTPPSKAAAWNWESFVV